MRNKYTIYSYLCMVTLALLCGCKDDKMQPLKPAAEVEDPAPDYIVAMVNGTPLTWEEMERRAMGFLKDDVETNHLIIPESRMEEAKEHFRKRSIQAFAYKTILLAEAIKANIKITPRDRERGLQALADALRKRNWTSEQFFKNGPMPEPVMRKEFEDGLIIEKYMKSQLVNRIKLQDGEVDALTKKLEESNTQKRKQLEDIRQQIIKGADFAEMAQKHSECPSSKTKGGDLGEFGRGKMDKQFERAAFTQKIGEVGPVINTPYGYHIIKVTAHSPAQAATDTTPAIPETIRASHILLKQTPVIKKKIIETLQKEHYKRESKKLYRELLQKADVKCFLYEDMEF